MAEGGLSKDKSAGSKRSGPKNTRRRRRGGQGQPRNPFEGIVPINANVAGVDIGSESHYTAVRAGDKMIVEQFGCLTPDLEGMAEWFKVSGVQSVVMESTGVYWVPVYELLEDHGFKVILVDARYSRNLPGRKKTDVHDCCWLHKLHSYGLLKPCYVPDKDVAEIRAYSRQRKMQVERMSREIQHMHKAMEQMNVQLHKVISDVTGVTGMAIMRAILAGERDPSILAHLRQTGIKSSEATITHALTGNWRSEHLFALKQAVDTYDFIRKQMAECDVALKDCLERYAHTHGDKTPKETTVIQEPAEHVEPSSEQLGAPQSNCAQRSGSSDAAGSKHPKKSSGPASQATNSRTDSDPPGSRRSRRRKPKGNEPRFDLHGDLIKLTGIDLTKINGIDVQTALVIVSECGPDLGAFETEGQFASWLGVCPNNRITGGAVNSTSTNKNHSPAATALRVAAQGLSRSKSALGAFYRRMRGRLGAPGAITATAHKLARLIFRMIKYGEEYVDRGQQWYEERYQQQRQKQLAKQAKNMGLRLVDAVTGAVIS